MKHSPYLARTQRSEAEAVRDCERAVELHDLLWGKPASHPYVSARGAAIQADAEDRAQKRADKATEHSGTATRYQCMECGTEWASETAHECKSCGSPCPVSKGSGW